MEILGTINIEFTPVFTKPIESDLISNPEVEKEKSNDKIQWPLLRIGVNENLVIALVDSGSQYNCISEEFYDIRQNNPNLPVFPVTGISIRGATILFKDEEKKKLSDILTKHASICFDKPGLTYSYFRRIVLRDGDTFLFTAISNSIYL